ncbi:MAG: PAS domain S-box protein [Elusimicrobia bacterium]|jgi:PAS domain S-box-containing protein|nr:PAS domain S-box protein [Elusimicrobiota bacterium]
MKDKKYVNLPDSYKDSLGGIFKKISAEIEKYFNQKDFIPEEGLIKISDQRYILMRSPSLSVDFFKTVREIYKKSGKSGADDFTRQFLFDLAHSMGINDAKNFHKKLNLKLPPEKLAAGPFHFAFSGWAHVNILDGSNPVPGKNFILIYNHANSFEAGAWLKDELQPTSPVCIMNAGYSSGWCEISFDTPLIATELTCRAAGDKECKFLMAPPSMIQKHLKKYSESHPEAGKVVSGYNIPDFFNLKKREEQLQETSEKLKLAFQNSNDAIVWADPPTRKIINVNRAAEKLFGRKKSELVGKLVSILHPPGKEKKYMRIFDRDINSAGVQSSRGEIITKSGALKQVVIFPSVSRIGEKNIIQGIFKDSTPKVKTETKLAEAEKKYANLLNNLPNPVILFTSEGKITYTNKSFREIFGYSKDKIKNLTIKKILDPSEKKLFLTNLPEDIKDIRKPTVYKFITKSGETLLLENSISFRKENGGPSYMSVCRDITEKADYLRKLEASRTRLNILFNFAPYAVFTTNYTGYITVANDRALKLFGKRRKDVIGHSLLESDFLSLKNIAKMTKLFFKKNNKSDQTPTNITLSSRGRQETLVEIISHSITIENERLKLFIARDITKHEEMQKQIIENEKKYRSIFELSPEVIMQIDKKGIIREVNERIYPRTGYRAEELKGESIFNIPLLSKESKKTVMKNFTKRLLGKQIDPYNLEIITKSGKKLIAKLYAAAIKDSSGHTTGEIVMMPDITFEINAKKELEEHHANLERLIKDRTSLLSKEVSHRKKSEENLSRSNEELASFAYTISHDMKAPFRAMQAFTSFLEKSAKEKLSDEEKDYINEIRSAVERMDEMMEGLLKHSRITSVKNP